MKMRALFSIVFCLLIVSGAAGQEKKVFTAVVDPDGIQRVPITGGEYYFEPAHIVVKANVPVELSVKKEGGFIPHDIVMDAPEAGMKFSEGFGKEPKIIAFTPTKPGKYSFYCSKKPPFFKSHRNRGMEGTLEVTE